MAVRTKDEIMASIKERIGDDQSDEAISLVEDISDTIDNMQSKANGDGIDWKNRYEENDANWRQKYRDRFFGKSSDEAIPGPNESEDEDPRLTYKNLFKEG